MKEEKIFEEEGLMGCETGKIPGRKKEELKVEEEGMQGLLGRE